MIQDTFWILRWFGIMAAIRFVWDSFSNLFRNDKIGFKTKFEDFSDEDAEKIAMFFGIFQWKNRQDLNQQWYDFEFSAKQTHENNLTLH